MVPGRREIRSPRPPPFPLFLSGPESVPPQIHAYNTPQQLLARRNTTLLNYDTERDPNASRAMELLQGSRARIEAATG